MILNLKKKKKIVSKISDVVKNASSVIVATIEGVSVNEITEFRKGSREIGVQVYVVRNTLMRYILKNTPFVCLQDMFSGQNIIVVSAEETSSAARICVQFSKKNDFFKIKAASFDGKIISASNIDILSNLLNKNESILRLITIMKKSSVGKLINLLHVLLNQRV